MRWRSSSLDLRGQSGSIALLEMTCFSTVVAKKMQFYVLRYWAIGIWLLGYCRKTQSAYVNTVSSDNNSSSSSI